MGHMDSMAPSNISRAPMVEQYNNGKQSALNYKRPSSASSDYNRCNPRSMGSNSSNSEERQILQFRKVSKEINPNRNSPINHHRRQQSLLPNKYQQFQMELYRPARSKRKTKTPKRISSSPTKMELENEKTNLE
jgi:hypothetical protein